MSQRNLIIITKIILFYSIFFVGLKLFVILSGGWPIPNLVLALPFLILAVVSGIMVKKENYSWFFVAVGAAVIILMRIYETQWTHWIQQQVGN
ncbi:hypothetical protein GCM10007103_21220 [Salinimicrobium marinum]|uniref:Uncharacterized protein n=1 Tax=Salinimicrobium marinum TaxID=680283 RepID=A0A918SHS7_9FLAO|nr:hypothetical protein [Salinimicrobium marinum]GHA39608.1 hypothetical protein GCM10007103_21220 [Salinimicrobium marinum]